jgi:hypothetical protein
MPIHHEQPQRIRAHPYPPRSTDEDIGYRSTQPPMTQPTETRDVPEITDNQPTTQARRGRRPARTGPPREQKFNQITEKLSQAIEKRSELNLRLTDNIHLLTSGEMVKAAACNEQLVMKIAHISEFEFMYIIGKGLEEIMRQEAQEPGFISWTTLGRRLGISTRHVRISRRTYELFKFWPGAIYQLRGIFISDIDWMTNEEVDWLILKLSLMYPPENRHLA